MKSNSLGIVGGGRGGCFVLTRSEVKKFSLCWATMVEVFFTCSNMFSLSCLRRNPLRLKICAGNTHIENQVSLDSIEKTQTPPLRISKHCFETMINKIIFRVLILVIHIYAKSKFDIVRDFFKMLDWKIMNFTNFSSAQENAGSSQNFRTNASFFLWIDTLTASVL